MQFGVDDPAAHCSGAAKRPLSPLCVLQCIFVVFFRGFVARDPSVGEEAWCLLPFPSANDIVVLSSLWIILFFPFTPPCHTSDARHCPFHLCPPQCLEGQERRMPGRARKRARGENVRDMDLTRVRSNRGSPMIPSPSFMPEPFCGV